ncbi:hypothetical protein [Streptomyces sp. NPDC058695]|uniref:hypothetical protein n=1 Tax=Streptomyces sp. NPDC058695 TaxID=3346604 RepID=UPI003652FB01
MNIAEPADHPTKAQLTGREAILKRYGLPQQALAFCAAPMAGAAVYPRAAQGSSPLASEQAPPASVRSGVSSTPHQPPEQVAFLDDGCP